MSAEKGSDPVQEAITHCTMTQCMIDITAKQLDGLRTECSPTEEITQKEIREAEAKLIKLFSKQLVAKARLRLDKIPEAVQKYPKIEQWLLIVGLNKDVVKSLVTRGVTLDSLLEMHDVEIRRLLTHYNASSDDVVNLNSALRSLKMWTERQLAGDRNPGVNADLAWTSYNRSTSSSPYSGNSPKFGHHQRPSTSSLPPDVNLNTSSPQSPASPPSPPCSTPASPIPYPSPAEQRRRYTPPPTPPLVRTTPAKGKFPTTPPPQKRNKLCPEVFHGHPLTKSKSHESQLAMRVNPDADKNLKKKPGNLNLAGSYETLYKRRRSTEGSDAGGSSRGPSGQASPLTCSPKRSPPYKTPDQVSLPDEVHTLKKPSQQYLKENQLAVPPVSPKTPLARSMMHSINHRFTNTFKITTCDFCQKQMFLGYKCRECKFQTKMVLGACDSCHKPVFRGKVCRYCKLKFHRDCAAKAAPACGLPSEYVDLFIDLMRDGGSPNSLRRVANHSMSLPAGDNAVIRQASSVPAFQVPDSSSNTSSCNSSTPSSPALFISSCQTPPSPAHPSPAIHVTPDTQFQFPEISQGSSSMTSTLDSTTSMVEAPSTGDNSDVVNTNTSNDSDKSDKTLTEGSTDRGSFLLDRVDSQESAEDGGGQSWQRNNSISVALKEWDIPYEELKLGEPIGTGRFGTVYRGQWHGDVAIKMLNMDPETDNQSQLQAFKLEVAMLRKTRHENLVLFMGACMKPPHLAIVTSLLCRGQTLYVSIHVRKDKFQLNRSVIIASQIAQGMGYLHAKGIVHKDLKTKNIFIESGKVVITDFGLFSVTKLCHGNRKGEWLSIPPGWLCYLSPEIMRCLQAGSRQDSELPFSTHSDIYAFGTVWYELLHSEWPFRSQPPEAIIWQVGKGMKQSLSNVHAPRDVKDLLMLCWSYKPDDRPSFAKLLKTLDRLPKKRLARSPSHPIQLSRSAESVF